MILFKMNAEAKNQKTHDEVSSLVGAGEQSGWMSVHLVLESGRSAILCLSSQSLPELVCERDRHSSSYHRSVCSI